ncbi:GNAT family N-acetyltransferase [Hymenobacter actinosclerus]|uniref:[SSU ribosomal protein S5P]-alanine acetyltransferase n=1 Tax=Hymenobacter actinosclerus TaxID=82805 RepID=A0A1I0H4Q5_9BACT|nr:GNAT family protein [Hymenobacter actinosclerus]SET78686.1 [SSU ribosomal protein S5P]-alanine acetyltransferase [Hymenobacter actinosclerus]
MLPAEFELATARLRLRPWQPTDAPALLALMNTNRARLQPDFPATTAAIRDLASAADFIAEKLREWAARTNFQLSIWEPAADGDCLGFISFTNLDWSVPKAELVGLVAAGYEGRGLMTEAGHAAVRWAFRRVGLQRLYCYIGPQNTRSLALVQRLGLRPEGLLRHNYRVGDGELVDSVVSGMIRADFFALPQRETA